MYELTTRKKQIIHCKLENQKSKSYSSIWVRRPEDRETDCWSKSKSTWKPGTLMSESRRWMFQLKKRICPSFTFLFSSGPQKDKMISVHIDEGKFLLSLLIQVLFFSVTSPQTYAEKMFYHIWASLSSVKLTSEINYHNFLFPVCTMMGLKHA